MKPLEKAAKMYLPPSPFRNLSKLWFQVIGIIFTAVLVVGVIAVLVRSGAVDASKQSHSRVVTEDKLYAILKKERPADESPIGRLATKLEGLMQAEHPIEQLQKYYVNSNELEAVRKQLGYDFFGHTYPSSECEGECYTNKEGNFTDDFIFKVYAARFEPEPSIYESTVPKVISSGVLQGKWLALSLVGLLLLMLVGWVGVEMLDDKWKENELKRFIGGLAEPQRAALQLIGELKQRPSGAYLSHIGDETLKNRERLREEAFSRRDTLVDRSKALFAAMREGSTDVDSELAALQLELTEIDKQEKDAIGDEEAGGEDGS